MPHKYDLYEGEGVDACFACVLHILPLKENPFCKQEIFRWFNVLMSVPKVVSVRTYLSFVTLIFDIFSRFFFSDCRRQRRRT